MALSELGISTNKQLLDMVYSLKRIRETSEPVFYMSRKAYEGKHFVVWNRDAKQLTELPVKKNIFNPVPELSKQVDSFENFLLSTNFTFTVVPEKLSDDKGVEDSMALSLLAQDKHKQLRDSTIFSDYVHFALLDNVSFLEITPNDKKTDVEYKVFDGFDVLFNPRIKDWDKQPLVVKVVRTTEERVRKSKLYKNLPNNISTVATTNFFSWKDIYEAEKYTSFTPLSKGELLLFECYIPTDNGLRIITIDGHARELRNDLYTKVKGIPLVPLRIYSGEWYQPSFAYRLIPMNRGIDLIFNRIEDLILRLAKGGWLVQEEETLKGGMNEEMGQIVKYSATKPEPIAIPTMPSFVMEWFSNIIGLSERYGLSSILSGNLPAKASGIRSGDMIDKITGQALSDNAAVINNLRASLKKTLEYTFAFLYELWDTPQDVLYGEFGQKFPSFVSEKYAQFMQDQNVVAIPSDFKRFDVDIDDGLGYTLEARKRTAVELNKLGVIGAETLKKIFKLGSSSYLVEAEKKPMYETEEFQMLLKNFPSMDAEQKQAVINTLQTIGQQVGDDPKMTGGVVPGTNFSPEKKANTPVSSLLEGNQ